MTKSEILQKCLNYCNIVSNTVKQNRKKDKNIFVRLLHTFSQNEFAVLGLTLATFIGTGFAMLSLTGYTLPIVFSISLGSGLMLGAVIPKVFNFVAMRSKSKFGLKYVKKFMNSYFEIMKEFVNKNYKNILKAKNEKEVSNEELEDFVNQTNIFAKKYHCYLKNVIGKKITQRNMLDYKKIEKIYEKNNSKNANKINKKIDNIIKSNNQFVRDWCNAYNECGHIAKNLYIYSNSLNNKFAVPSDANFYMDNKYLNKQVENNIYNKGLKESKYDDTTENVTFSSETVVKYKDSAHTNDKYKEYELK